MLGAVVVVARTDPPDADEAQLRVDAATPSTLPADAGPQPAEHVPRVADGPAPSALPTPGERTEQGAVTLDTLPHSVIVADAFSRLQIVDPTSGDITTVQVLPRPSRTRPRALRATDDSVVLDTADDVIRLPWDRRQATLLAGDHRSVPTFDTTSLWVFDGVDFTGRDNDAGGTASRLALDGAVLDRVAVPAVAQPLAGTRDALVLRTPNATIVAGTDGSARRVAAGPALASDGNRIARLECGDELTCAIVVGTLDDPDQARTPLPAMEVPADLDGVPRARFSPDGRWLALSIYRARRTGLVDRSHVSILDVATGREEIRVDGSPLTEPHTPFAWTPDGRWLVLSSGDGLRLWDARERTLRTVDVDVAPTYALAVR